MTTPQPPQGGNPFAQQAPQGQPGYGYPQQGAPQGPPPGGGFPPPAPTPSRPRSNRKVLRIVIGLVVVAVIAVAAIIFSKDSDTQQSKVGDCFHNKGTNSSPDMQKVDCTAANAQYKVGAKFENTTDGSKCTAKGYPIYYFESGRGDDLLLCLSDVKK